MIICVCHNIDEKTLNSLILEHEGDRRKIVKECKIGMSCGTCLETFNSVCETLNDKNLCSVAIRPNSKKRSCF